MQLKIETLSKTGGRKANEDACGYCTIAEITCCILSDGLGGHEGGAIASKLSVEHVLEAFKKSPQCSIDNIKLLMHKGNNAVLNEQIKKENPNIDEIKLSIEKADAMIKEVTQSISDAGVSLSE